MQVGLLNDLPKLDCKGVMFMFVALTGAMLGRVCASNSRATGLLGRALQAKNHLSEAVGFF